MKKRYIIILIVAILIFAIIFIFLGMLIGAFGENLLMGDYDLYNCIYNNADRNNFNKHPVMIQKIQDECICFRQNNYTNLLGKC